MKSKFLLLTKINFLNSFDFQKMKRNKAKTISTLTYMLLIGLLFLAISTLYSIIFGNMFLESGLPIIESSLFMAGLCTMIIISTSFSSVNMVFAGKDYDMLNSMPLTKSQIVGSKLVSIYLVELTFSAIVMLPNSIVNLVLTGQIIDFIVPFVMMLLLPVVPLTIGSILSIIISVLSGKGRLSNIISTILYVAFFASFMVVGMLIGQTQYAGSMSSTLSWFNPTLKIFDLHLSTYSCLGIFMAVNGLLLVIIMVALSLCYDFVHTAITSVSSNIKYKQKHLKNKTEFKTLFINDIKKIINSKNCIMQYLVGPIASSILIVFIAFTSFEAALLPAEIQPYIEKYLPLILMFPALMATMAVPSSTLLSLEGKQMWFIKSSPISPKKFMFSKLLISLLITVPCYIIATTGLAIALAQPIKLVLLCGSIGLLYTVLINLIGLFIGMLFPKFKFDNEVKVIKQSTPVWVMMAADFGILVVLGIGGFFLLSINWYLGLLALISFLALSCIVFLILLLKKIEPIFEKYEEF